MKANPLPIATHANIAATLRASVKTGTAYHATPVEAPLTLICVNGSPPPRNRAARTEDMDVSRAAIYKAIKGKFQFISGSVREQVWNLLCQYPKGLTLSQIQHRLPRAGGIVAVMQKLCAAKKVAAI